MHVVGRARLCELKALIAYKQSFRNGTYASCIHCFRNCTICFKLHAWYELKGLASLSSKPVFKTRDQFRLLSNLLWQEPKRK